MRAIAISIGVALVISLPERGLSAASPSAVAEGDAIIAAAQAKGVFKNMGKAPIGKIMLRHLPSKLDCLFWPGQSGNRIVILSKEKGAERVVCESRDEQGAYSWVVFRPQGSKKAPLKLVTDTMKAEIAAFVAAHPDARKLDWRETIFEGDRPGPTYTVFATGPSADATKVTYDDDFRPMVTVNGPVVRIDVATRKGWVIERQATGQADVLAGRHAGTFFEVGLRDMADDW